jgi:hypothetical protein
MNRERHCGGQDCAEPGELALLWGGIDLKQTQRRKRYRTPFVMAGGAEVSGKGPYSHWSLWRLLNVQLQFGT